MFRLILLFGLSLLSSVLLGACATSKAPVGGYENVCEIFQANPKWYQAAKKSTAARGGNIQLPMSIIYQESSFKNDARPARERILGFIPGSRPSNAYGYAQALKGTWAEYEESVGSKRKRRDRFADAFDFVQWYIHKTHLRNKVSKWDYADQYLNYHEGQGGYSRGTHLQKKWLLDTAQRVDSRAKRYSKQLAGCADMLDKMKVGWF